MKRWWISLIVLLGIVPARAQVADSTCYALPDEAFRWQQLIAPTVLVGVGAVGVTSPWWARRIDLPVQKAAADIRGEGYIHADDYIQYVPAAIYFGAGFIPHQGTRTAGERALVLGTAWLSMGIMVNAVKYSVREPRPDNGRSNSFPSGHTATAFMGAELVRHEYGPLWGFGAYSIATATAVLRIYNNRHWTHDVLAGAGIGILSANIGYWMLPLERRLFRMEHRDKKWVAAPWWDGQQGYGVSFAMTF